ncbi:hypothetical protein CCAX7_22910 [Capsulimonas corticalis]|uniref:Uncharacterized protein n=1 Tax=Capsulimonas corticalis TaxID=2219043 RepID=A0A402CV21_9BACT|nr:Clp protease N-terminal domain-containing protein [Capsulimonas corticalis]BDI30240.1 hypothetical protein CCAX7_22910 [Capsulimonas corticalis]
MWQRFSEGARKTVFFAQEEAAELGQIFVAPEHLLLGLLRERETSAGRLLRAVGADPGVVRDSLLQQSIRGDEQRGDKQLTPRAKRVIDLAYEAATDLQDDYIGTEHLLLGVLRENESMAAKVLNAHGVLYGVVLAKIREMRGSGEMDQSPRLPTPPSTAMMNGDNAVPQVVTAFLQMAITQRAERIQWKLGEDVGVSITIGDETQPLASLPGHLSDHIRYYFEAWARLSGAGDLAASRHPVRLAFFYQGRDYDFHMTEEEGGVLALTVTPI